MNTSDYILSTAFEAVADMAYRLNEVFPLYPITPTSEMSERVAAWSASGKKNIFGQVPVAVQMQSEAGSAATLHGAIQTGALASTFTASQGLLLMLPNLFKMAGELSPNVVHVASRSVASHALSVFPDHSDIMAVRQSGYAMLGAASLQEAHDFALISQVASLVSRVPFLHFFDGFRTSHEYNALQQIPDSVVREMLPADAIREHRSRALSPEAPVLRGSSQLPDIFFQCREASSPYYESCPGIVQETMDRFARITGRPYKLMEYVGHPEAERVLVAMASSCETIAGVVRDGAARGERIGLVKIRLYRPFGTAQFREALPASCKRLAVLDRTLEPGSTGEPLFLDVAASLGAGGGLVNIQPQLVRVRYGLGGKDLAPHHVAALFDELGFPECRPEYTLGIRDQRRGLQRGAGKKDFSANGGSGLYPMAGKGQDSMSYCEWIIDVSKSVAHCEAVAELAGMLFHPPVQFAQRYDVPGYDKTEARLQSHLRIGQGPISAPYEIERPGLVVCDNEAELRKLLRHRPLKEDGIALICTGNDTSVVPAVLKIIATMADPGGNGPGILPDLETLDQLIAGLARRVEPELPGNTIPTGIAAAMRQGLGNLLSVDMVPPDGTFDTDTARDYRLGNVREMPNWDPEACVQCGLCSAACPTGALRAKVIPESANALPIGIKTAQLVIPDLPVSGESQFSIQIDPGHCTACGLCSGACPEGALVPDTNVGRETAHKDWLFMESLPDLPPAELDGTSISHLQFLRPYFRGARGVVGCGEAPYLKMISQLYGDRLLVANATGSSSIFGGYIPAIPWEKDSAGRGPAWSNSLFEDAAEFGLGLRLGRNHSAAKPGDSIVWIVGGDGWAYDIGFGGLDHVLASGEDVNILVLDNEVYSNTGGQMSKATPMGAIAGMATRGRNRHKKDLGALARQYDDVYVASISLGADPAQALRALAEAGSHRGPSLVIAYCHSPEHGIDIADAGSQHQMAVASGMWSLYRRQAGTGDGRPGKLELDSPAPYLPVVAFLKGQDRFREFLAGDVAGLQTRVDERYRKLTREAEPIFQRR